MCDPLTLTVAAGTAISAGGQIAGGIAANKAAEATAGAQLAVGRANAKLILAQGNVRENQLRRQVDGVIASQTAYFAANNIDPAAGSPLVLAGLSAAAGEADARLIRADALVRSAEAIAGAALTAGATEAQGKQALTAGIVGAATTLLKGGAQIWGGLPQPSAPVTSVGSPGFFADTVSPFGVR